MNVGFIGLGKLGLPSALAIESKGHKVVGFDINPKVGDYIKNHYIPYKEEGAPELLAKTKIEFLSVAEVLRQSEIIFVPVQTPHDPLYEGTTKLPSTTADFNYEYLKSAIKEISKELDQLGEDRIVIIVSTVLPGTIEREIVPLLSKHVKLCYNPFFIAMGTTVKDFLYPEIVLFGRRDPEAVDKAKEFYRTITDAPLHEMSIVNAELVKVNYNTFITMKINFANNLMEVCHKLRDKGADVDVVIDALSNCKRRIISSSYMRGGMPDSGGCHPRDNIALADMVKKLDMKNDLYTEQMKIREHHIKWFADEMLSYNLPLVILGKAYKPETNLTIGSSAIRLHNELKEKGVKCHIWDPYVDKVNGVHELREPHVFFIGTKHDDFKNFNFPKGSVIIDPFRYIPKQEDIQLIRLGTK